MGGKGECEAKQTAKQNKQSNKLLWPSADYDPYLLQQQTLLTFQTTSQALLVIMSVWTRGVQHAKQMLYHYVALPTQK